MNVGDKWLDDEGNEFEVIRIDGTVIVSDSVEVIIDVEE